jgi:CheY-like chemotaxis protein
MLEKLGHAAELARNGQEALERIVEQKFDVVLMDVQMPEMDGLTANQHVRASEKKSGGHLPIIAMTARAMRGTGRLAWPREWTDTCRSQSAGKNCKQRSWNRPVTLVVKTLARGPHPRPSLRQHQRWADGTLESFWNGLATTKACFAK